MGPAGDGQRQQIDGTVQEMEMTTKSKQRVWGLAWVATAILLALAGYAIFFVAPRELTMGNIQRIFYVHVATAWCGFIAFFISFFGCIGYLASRQMEWDWLAVATAEVGLMFTTVVLITGPVWAKPVWGVWWVWDARLTTAFILEMLYIAYLLLRKMVTEPGRRAMISAVFGIFAFLDVPLCYFSIRWWRTLHPAPVIGGGPGSGINPVMWHVFLFGLAGFLALTVILVRDRYRMEALRQKISELAADLEEREESLESKEVTR
jgi:heme exporter protein C